jgi:hypothetical protein
MGYDYTAYFQQLRERVNSAVRVPFHEVQLKGEEPRLNDCHRNVDCWVKNHPETKAVRGWLFWPPNEAGQYTFMAHSIVDENGQLVDITPLDPNTRREGLVFLKHLGTEEDFSVMKTPCSRVLYPPFTYDEWHDSQLPVVEEAMNS